MAASSASPAGPSKSDFPRRQARRLTSWREGPVPWPGTGGRREEGAQGTGLPGFLHGTEEEILGMGHDPGGQFRFSAPGVRCWLRGGEGFKALDLLDPRCTKAGS
ncbi:hypothetical protein Q7C36_016659 [Tachysurus vachellii]|uniref:Uncharacterized protein n=1 Tax=Tachysurus vachellii TaxID=175792 RepID=A0AA88M9Q6_TACVA|nr:hypothetical protein Q7C36_016659 [Tachysurus vachellii]